MEETNNKSIPFKTFDDWVKARTTKCDMALKDALSFVSEKKSSHRWGEGLTTEQDLYHLERSSPSNTEPSSWWTDSPSDPQLPKKTPTDRGEILHGVQKRRVHHGAHENIPLYSQGRGKNSFQDH